MDRLDNILTEGDRVAFLGVSRDGAGLETGVVSAVVLPCVRIDRDKAGSWLPRLWRQADQVVKVATA